MKTGAVLFVCAAVAVGCQKKTATAPSPDAAVRKTAVEPAAAKPAAVHPGVLVLEKMEKDACACEDAGCVVVVMQRGYDAQAKLDPSTASDADRARIKQAMDRVKPCYQRFPAEVNEAVRATWEATLDVCDCPDLPCAQAALGRGTERMKQVKPTKATADDARSITHATDRMQACVAKLSDRQPH